MHARTTGAILMISGRVPTTIGIFAVLEPSCLRLRPSASRASPAARHSARLRFRPRGLRSPPRGQPSHKAYERRGWAGKPDATRGGRRERGSPTWPREGNRLGGVSSLGSGRPLPIRGGDSMSSSWLAIVLIPAAVVASSAVPGAATAAGPRVTIYTHDLGFVRETRTLDLGGARDTVRIEDVPARLDFSSARLAPAGDLKLTRPPWRYHVASGDVLIDRAVGRRVRVTSRGDRATEGTLVSADGSWLVVRADDGALNSVARQALETVRLANPAGDMALRPSLEAVREGGKPGPSHA